MPEHLTNPETERHQQLLTKLHQQQRQEAIGLLIFSTLLIVLVILITIPTLLNGKTDPPHLIILFALLLAGLISLPAGLQQYQEGKQPPSKREINQNRQQERIEHFQIAQSKLPWRYSKTARICIAILALLLIISSLELIHTNNPYIITQDILSIIGGTILLLYTLILSLRAKQLPEESAIMLKDNLSASEGIEEDTNSPDEKQQE